MLRKDQTAVNLNAVGRYTLRGASLGLQRYTPPSIHAEGIQIWIVRAHILEVALRR